MDFFKDDFDYDIDDYDLLMLKNTEWQNAVCDFQDISFFPKIIQLISHLSEGKLDDITLINGLSECLRKAPIPYPYQVFSEKLLGIIQDQFSKDFQSQQFLEKLIFIIYYFSLANPPPNSPFFSESFFREVIFRLLHQEFYFPGIEDKEKYNLNLKIFNTSLATFYNLLIDYPQVVLNVNPQEFFNIVTCSKNFILSSFTNICEILRTLRLYLKYFHKFQPEERKHEFLYHQGLIDFIIFDILTKNNPNPKLIKSIYPDSYAILYYFFCVPSIVFQYANDTSTRKWIERILFNIGYNDDNWKLEGNFKFLSIFGPFYDEYMTCIEALYHNIDPERQFFKLIVNSESDPPEFQFSELYNYFIDIVKELLSSINTIK